MRREGRQHGLVRTHMISDPRPSSRSLNKRKASAVAGAFVKVSKKPTNHSKFTGKLCNKPKCISCQSGPVSKSKSKGAKKFARTSEVFTVYVDGPTLISRESGEGLNSADDDYCYASEEEEEERNGCCSSNNDEYGDWLLVEDI